ncbi:hypothetical protein [Nocardiopsis algeriensis]|uniref:Uncharacterized protein n=1 Tax=Nocardiopsis algeriensis TaxID=1478215 RepID=A0A841IUR1_9ACTN|nr:hypothetical protein [Nocardiopsis algeriensis]MBB6121912.1 hypothetical protein [Nocardiopsis algeriensis]
MIWRPTPTCREEARTPQGRPCVCWLDRGHDGDHEDAAGYRWEPPGVALRRLRDTWGGTHRIAWTGTLWIATARSQAAPWRTEIEPTPAQLEDRLRHRGSPPTIPAPR